MSAVVRIRNVTVGDNRSTTSCTRNPISAGEAAGIGIGGVVVGALLSCLTICIFMARSKRHRRREGDLSGVGKNVGVPIVAPVETFLDRADDSQLRKSMQNLDEIIDQHVENHYHLQAFGGSRGSLERCLVECGYNIEPSVPEMVALLVNPRTRFAGIRQVIGMILLGNVDCRSRAELSLLPPQIVGFCQSIPPVERQPGSDEVFDKAFTKWRHLSAFLLEPMRSSREAPKANEQELQGAISRNIALINGVLKPFIKPGLESQRYQEDNLSAIIFEGAQLGLLLFSQSSVWVFGWKSPSREEVEKIRPVVTTTRKGKVLVVFPSLGERTERHGRQRLREVSLPVVIDL